MPVLLTKEQIASIERDISAKKLTKVAIAAKHKVNRDTVYRLWKDLKERGAYTPYPSTEPIPLDYLGPLAKRALREFEFFFVTYIAPYEANFAKYCPDGLLPEIQNEIARKMTSADGWNLITIHPGIGKTTLVNAWLIWKILNDRNIRAFYITKSREIGKSRLRWIKFHLDGRNEALLRDFGRLKPNTSDAENNWTTESITVAGATIISKEPTLAIYGAGQGIYGTRVGLIVADDVVDINNSTTRVDREFISDWWHTQVESRLEPEGTGIVLGTRLSPADLYGHLGNLQNDEGEKVYSWTKYKAHDLAKCDGDEHRAYPGGCLLFPTRWPLPKLNNGIRTGATWALVYQQEDVPADDVLVERAWITGAKDSLDLQSPGCLDHDRFLGQLPLKTYGTSVVTMDPSPTRYWAIQWWLVEAGDPPTWHLVDFIRRKMSPSDILDFQGQVPVGLLRDWKSRSDQAHAPIRYVIVEANAAQRWLLQSFMSRRWAQSNGVNVLAHQTNVNKGDPKLGVWTMRLRFRDGKVRIPYADPNTRAAVSPFINELCGYPHSDTDDTVMAAWFLHWNERKIKPGTMAVGWGEPPLPYLRAQQGLVDPKTQKFTPRG